MRELPMVDVFMCTAQDCPEYMNAKTLEQVGWNGFLSRYQCLQCGNTVDLAGEVEAEWVSVALFSDGVRIDSTVRAFGAGQWPQASQYMDYLLEFESGSGLPYMFTNKLPPEEPQIGGVIYGT